jgi:hypothetical protein
MTKRAFDRNSAGIFRAERLPDRSLSEIRLLAYVKQKETGS